MENNRLFLVSASVLPSVYQKVVEAKRLLSSGEVSSVADAVRSVGISRSAFYKYKDCVFTYDASVQSEIITIQSTLDDRPGVLSALLAYLSDSGANILTINQSIPVGGTALVSVSASLGGASRSPEGLLEGLRALDGVRSIGSISGN